MNTSALFENELNYIQNDLLREIVKDTLDCAPKCIQIIPASSSKKYHPEYAVITGSINNNGDVYEGGLMRHIKAAVGIAHCMLQTDIFKNMLFGTGADYYESIVYYKDAVYASLILHDCMKPDDTEKHNTRFDHPLLAAKLFKKTVSKHINKENVDYLKEVAPMIYNAIASHMGQFNTASYAKDIELPKPRSVVDQFVHMCDYLASRKFLIFDFENYH